MSSVITQDDRRSAYRVQPADVDELDLAMLAQRQRLVHGEVTDVRNGGACVRFDRDTSPNFASGDPVTLSLNSQRHNYTGEVQARIVSATDESSKRIVHLSFEEQHENITGKSREYFELFNRRAAYRSIKPADSVQFNAAVAPDINDGASVEVYPVSIRNISNTSIAFDVNETIHKVLQHHAALRLSLEFPKEEQASTIACRVRHRTAITGAFIYGCEYDWSATANSLAVVENIVTYIMERLDQGPT